MEGDISNKTIVVLVVLTVLISVLSTLVILNEISSVNVSPASQGGQTSASSTGKLSLEVRPAPVHSSTTGQVILGITPRKNN